MTKLDFKLDNISDAAIDIKVDNFNIFNAISGILEFALKDLITVFFKRGFPMQWLLTLLKIDFIELDHTLLLPFDGYFVFYCTPEFNIELATQNIHHAIV